MGGVQLPSGGPHHTTHDTWMAGYPGIQVTAAVITRYGDFTHGKADGVLETTCTKVKDSKYRLAMNLLFGLQQFLTTAAPTKLVSVVNAKSPTKVWQERSDEFFCSQLYCNAPWLFCVRCDTPEMARQSKRSFPESFWKDNLTLRCLSFSYGIVTVVCALSWSCVRIIKRSALQMRSFFPSWQKPCAHLCVPEYQQWRAYWKLYLSWPALMSVWTCPSSDRSNDADLYFYCMHA